MDKIRTIKGAIAEMRESDPNTEFNEFALRGLIKEGKIPYLTSGKKILVNMAVLESYLRGDQIA